MKKNLLLILALGAMIQSCTPPSDIMDDFQVHITPDFYSYTIEVNVQELGDPDVILPSDFEIELTGPDAIGVYYLDGTKNFKLSGNLLQLLVAREFEPGPNDSLEFTINFIEPGYRKESLNVVVSEGRYHERYFTSVINFSNLPEYLKLNTYNVALDPQTNALAQDFTMVDTSSGSFSSYEITIPSGTQFYDEDGNLIRGKRNKTGDFSFNFNVLGIFSSNRSYSLGPTFDIFSPSNRLGYSNPSVRVRNSGPPRVFAPRGPSPSAAVTLEDRFGTSISQFRIPQSSMNFRFYLPNDYYNIKEERLFRRNDRINALYYDNDLSAWIDDLPELIVAESADERLYVDIPISKPGPVRLWQKGNQEFKYFFAGYFEPLKPDPSKTLEGGVNINFPNMLTSAIAGDPKTSLSLGGVGLFYTKPMNPISPYSGSGLSGWVSEFTSYEVLNLTDVTPEVYSFYDLSGYDWSIEQITNPPAGYDFGYAIKYRQVSEGVNIGFTLQCDGAFVLPPAGTLIRYREHSGSTGCDGNSGYQVLHSFTNENLSGNTINFTQLEDGKYYDFQALHGGQVVDTCNVKIEDGKIYNVIAPTKVCNAIGL